MTTIQGFSIDFEAEIRKITQRQQLNAVHFIVQLVRHALRHLPASIDIQVSASQLVFNQDGKPISEVELEQLIRVLERQPGQDAQAALAEMELQQGIALLNLFWNFSHVRLRSGSYQLERKGERYEVSRNNLPMSGYLLELNKAEFDKKGIGAELDYYAGGCKVPIRLNGLPLAKKPGLTNQVVEMKFEGDDFVWWFGLPKQGELNRIQYRKQGVVYGFSQSEPINGYLYNALWDDADPSFEPNYQKSSSKARTILKEETEYVYIDLRERYDELDLADKARMRQIYLRLQDEEWVNLYGDMPLFHSTDGPFRLCMDDLLELRHHYDYLPYIPSESSLTAPSGLPKLSWQELWILRNRFNIPAKIYRPSALLLESSPQLETRAPASEAEKVSFTEMQAEIKPFLSILKLKVPEIFFELTDKPSHKSNGICYLNPTDPLVLAAFASWQKELKSATMLAYRLSKACSKVGIP